MPQKKTNKILRNYIKKFYFKKICNELKNIDLNTISDIKTNNGNTQISERKYIPIIKQCLDKLNYSYEEAGSQQSKDFRNIKNIGLNIEAKKADKFNIFFNDTCPSSDIYYIIIFTGKKYKKKNMIDIKPQIIFINGYDLIKDDIYYIIDYNKEIKASKDKWNRKKNKNGNACKFKHMKVNPRPTYMSDIKYLLNSNSSYQFEYKLKLRKPGDMPKPKSFY